MTQRERRAQLTAGLAPVAAGEAAYQVTIIAAGTANGYEWTGEALAEAVAAGQFARLPSFVDHRLDPTLIGKRSVRDLCGVVSEASYDAEAQAVRGVFRPLGPLGAWVDALLRDMLTQASQGRPALPLGLSIDVSFYAGQGRVERISRVHSADVVYQPAAGGVFETRLSAEANREAGMPERVSLTEEGGQGAGLSQALLVQQCRATLDATLAACELPVPLREEVRAQFQGRVFTPEELDTALSGKRATWAALAESGVVRGLGDGRRPTADGSQVGGSAVGGRRSALLTGMLTELDRVQLAVDRLFGLALPDAVADTPRLTGIRELYHLVTGDYDLYGVFNAGRVALANANATTMAGLVTNAMNKVIAARTEELGRAGYDWWRAVVHEEDFNSLQDIRWVSVGGFGDLPSIDEGAAYTELAWDDTTETTSWTKKGGYLGLTLEMIDRDETRRVRRIPGLLATAAIRTLSGTVAGLFTQNSGVGPTLADSVALFDASRGNLGTAALSAATWDAAVQAMFKQTELVSAKRLGIRPRYLLVPIELEKTALQIFVSPTEPSSNAFYDNVRRSAAGNVVPVPEWTDANDWAAVADPRIAPGIGVGYRFGRTPEVFVADQPEVGSMFTNDELRIKTRFFYGVGVIDYRPLYKANVS